MAIPDLLWACPRCGRDRGLREGKRGAACQSCGTRFERVRGARIRARVAASPDAGGAGNPASAAGDEVRSAADWVRRLPAVDSLLDRGQAQGEGPVRSARVRVRFVVGEQTVRGGGRYLNRMERYGPHHEGSLRLHDARLELRLDSRQQDEGAPKEVGSEHLRSWDFEALRAVQTSSRSLQVRDAAGGVASFRFLDDSIFLWEQLLTAALRRFYSRTGRGEIVEFQPRIVTA